jgi:hypothetical protein
MPLITGDALDENGIIHADALADTPSPIMTVLATSPSYNSTFVDLKWTSKTNLLTHIEGSSWIVDYYSQVIDTSNNLSGQQYTKNPVYQSYTLIKDMEMKVTSPLSTSQDPDTKGMTVTGTALLYSFIIPNEGDMFVADIGEGKLAVFRITDSIKKSIFKEACYEISYGLQDDNNKGSIDNLNLKVVKTLYYHKDFLTNGQNPLLVSNDNDVYLKLNKAYSLMAEQYFKKFFSNEFKTIMVPGQEFSTYDHFLVDYLLSEFSTADSNEIKYIRRLNLDDDDCMKSDSLWKALKFRDISFMNTVFKQAGLTSSRYFIKDPVLNGIRYTGIDRVVYPLDPVLSVDYLQVNRSKDLLPDILTPSVLSSGINNSMVRAINLRGTTQKTLESIYLVTKDDYYVLSKDFYDKTVQQSVLENITWGYLSGEAIDATQLLDTAKTYFTWGILEQFYYIPIILTLIRSTIRGM